MVQIHAPPPNKVQITLKIELCHSNWQGSIFYVEFAGPESIASRMGMP
jgi:hypothetical protein